MFSESAELYDLIYSRLKDYEAESEMVAGLISDQNPGARTVLDVACGTGEHVRLLRASHGFDVDGLDLDNALLAAARRKCPRARFWTADMSDFDLGRRYDVVMCLFSAIGYSRTVEGLTRVLGLFRAHLADGGVILVEPWFPPGGLSPGRVFLTTVETDEITIARMGVAEVSGRLSRSRFHYLVGKEGKVEYADETHELGLFSQAEMISSFEAAGLVVSFDEKGPSGRGLYVARAG